MSAALDDFRLRPATEPGAPMVVDVTGEPGAPMMIVGFGVFGASGSVTVSALKVYHLAN